MKITNTGQLVVGRVDWVSESRSDITIYLLPVRSSDKLDEGNSECTKPPVLQACHLVRHLR